MTLFACFSSLAFVSRELIDVMLSNHASFDNSIPKMQALRAAGPGAANPFVIGSDAVQRRCR